MDGTTFSSPGPHCWKSGRIPRHLSQEDQWFPGGHLDLPTAFHLSPSVQHDDLPRPTRTTPGRHRLPAAILCRPKDGDSFEVSRAEVEAIHDRLCGAVRHSIVCSTRLLS